MVKYDIVCCRSDPRWDDAIIIATSSVVSTRILLVTPDEQIKGSFRCSRGKVSFSTAKRFPQRGGGGKSKILKFIPNSASRYIYIYFSIILCTLSLERIRHGLGNVSVDILQGSGYSNKGIGENKQESRGKRSQVKIAGVVASYSTNKLIRLNGLIIRGLRGVLS